MAVDLLPAFVGQHYEVHEWKHACAILKQDFPLEWDHIAAVLVAFRLHRSWIDLISHEPQTSSSCELVTV